MRTLVFTLSLATLVACGGSAGSDASQPTQPVVPAAPVQSYPVTYALTLLKSPYAPGSVFSRSVECGLTLQSSITAGTLTIQKGGGGTISLRAWDQFLTVRNSIGCKTSVVTEDASITKPITWVAVPGTGAFSVKLTSQVLASGQVSIVNGDAKFPGTLQLDFPGYPLLGTTLFASPYSALSTGTEWRQVAQ